MVQCLCYSPCLHRQQDQECLFHRQRLHDRFLAVQHLFRLCQPEVQRDPAVGIVRGHHVRLLDSAVGLRLHIYPNLQLQLGE